VLPDTPLGAADRQSNAGMGAVLKREERCRGKGPGGIPEYPPQGVTPPGRGLSRRTNQAVQTDSFNNRYREEGKSKVKQAKGG
jgi:hypothetical protein